MNEQKFEQELAKHVAQIEALPAAERESLELLVDETFKRQQEFSEMFNNMGEAIDFVRVAIKYLLFDLEATRREKQQLLGMLRDSTAQPDGEAVEE